jgi:hypothetical protein
MVPDSPQGAYLGADSQVLSENRERLIRCGWLVDDNGKRRAAGVGLTRFGGQFRVCDLVSGLIFLLLVHDLNVSSPQGGPRRIEIEAVHARRTLGRILYVQHCCCLAPTTLPTSAAATVLAIDVLSTLELAPVRFPSTQIRRRTIRLWDYLEQHREEHVRRRMLASKPRDPAIAGTLSTLQTRCRGADLSFWGISPRTSTEERHPYLRALRGPKAPELLAHLAGLSNMAARPAHPE